MVEARVLEADGFVRGGRAAHMRRRVTAQERRLIHKCGVDVRGGGQYVMRWKGVTVAAADGSLEGANVTDDETLARVVYVRSREAV